MQFQWQQWYSKSQQVLQESILRCESSVIYWHYRVHVPLPWDMTRERGQVWRRVWRVNRILSHWQVHGLTTAGVRGHISIKTAFACCSKCGTGTASWVDSKKHHWQTRLYWFLKCQMSWFEARVWIRMPTCVKMLIDERMPSAFDAPSWRTRALFKNWVCSSVLISTLHCKVREVGAWFWWCTLSAKDGGIVTVVVRRNMMGTSEVLWSIPLSARSRRDGCQFEDALS